MGKDLPSGFKENMRNLLGQEADDFFAAMAKEPAVSVRLNRRKPGAHFPESRKVKWCDSGYYLPTRPLFTLDPLFHAGAYYVQDASSMIYEKTVEKLRDSVFLDLSPQSPLYVLDMCAAPGGKTTAMLNALPDSAVMKANEFVPKRAAILKENLTKWGYGNIEVTSKDTSFFARSGAQFDIVAVDAPCSGEGMMRKDEEARAQWSPDLVKNCASLQKDILRNAEMTLKPGGVLIYSTCTFNREENEENIDYAVNELGLIPLDLGFPEDWGIMHGIDTPFPVYRFMPHYTEGEGLFLAVLRKQGEWIPSKITEKDSPQSKNKKISVSMKNNSLHTGKSRKNHAKPSDDRLPEIEEILAWNAPGVSFPKIELSREEALKYLRRESFILPEETPRGYLIASYRGLPLGPLKNIGKRANNLYPKNWRILMQDNRLPK